MSPKLIINNTIEAPTKEDLLRQKIEELLKKNEEMREELEKLRKMI